MNALILSRVQFALTVMFHYVFPLLTIGTGGIIAYLLWRYQRTGDEIYGSAARFWTRIFALNFAIGVASGIVMEFEFGTNWAHYSRFVGDVFGSALAAEGIFAFFLESGFLAILVFGWERVSRRMLFISSVLVWLGSIFSSFWIVIANSWQQTPAGSHIVQRTAWNADLGQYVAVFYPNGEPAFRAEIVDFWAMVFNPSTVQRLGHVLLACFVVGAFFVTSISAFYVLRDRHREFARRSFRGGLVLGTFASIAVAISGHFQAQNVYRHQPAKLAAFEGQYETGIGNLTVFGWPNDAAARVDHAIEIPGLLSFLVHDRFDEDVVGLDRIPEEDRPPTLIPFIAWRAMIVSGSFLILLSLISCFFWWRGTLFEKRWLMWLHIPAILLAILGNQAGWAAAEVGRQPWIVHPILLHDGNGDFVFDDGGFVVYAQRAQLANGDIVSGPSGLRTADGVSEELRTSQVLASLIFFGVVYLLLGAVWIFVLDRKIRQGPEPLKRIEQPHDALLDVAGARHDDRSGLLGEPLNESDS